MVEDLECVDNKSDIDSTGRDSRKVGQQNDFFRVLVYSK